MRITQRRMRRDSTEKVMIWNYKGGISMGILKFTMRAVIKLLIFTITISFAIIKFVFFVYTLDVFTWIFRIKDAKILTLYVSSIRQIW